jgi:hypothetical protein
VAARIVSELVHTPKFFFTRLSDRCFLFEVCSSARLGGVDAAALVVPERAFLKRERAHRRGCRIEEVDSKQADANAPLPKQRNREKKIPRRHVQVFDAVFARPS